MEPIKILKLTKNKRHYTVETTQGKVKLTEETIIKYHIFKDHTFDPETWEAIQVTERQNQALNKALNYLSYRLRSQAELETYLTKLELTPEELELVINKVRELGFIDDERFAREMMLHYQNQGKGPRAIAQKLLEKGLSNEIITRTLTHYENESAIALRVAQKYLPRITAHPVRRQTQMVRQHLASHGFQSSTIQAVLGQLTYQDESAAALVKYLERNYDDLAVQVQREKLINRLLRRGYNYQEITKTIRLVEAGRNTYEETT